MSGVLDKIKETRSLFNGVNLIGKESDEFWKIGKFSSNPVS